VQATIKISQGMDTGKLIRLVQQAREGGAIALARSSALGLGGLMLFNTVVFMVINGPSGGADVLGLVALPLAMLICFPPLVLATGLRGRQPDLLSLGALTVSGPVSSGLWLGSLSPLVILYGLTGEANAAFGLLVFCSWVTALFFGWRAVVQNARDLGESGPGVVIALIHGAFMGWTTLILAAQLAIGG
jgi:hypothetical protein